MQYFALLVGTERDVSAAEADREMQAYRDFHARAGTAILEGDPTWVTLDFSAES